ncbi:MAG: YbaK/EbsC family protein [Bacillota bacterium]|nr:YbaK/EbsC family protein [Bacillota bacterium]MDW7684638.1 YbaK/EbsC family protein [Bacillota bacterium]
MKELEQKIIDYIRDHNIEAKHLSFDVSCHSVDEAAEAAGASAKEFVKNICLVDPAGGIAVAIVRGCDRVSTKKAAKILGVKKTRMATPDEILENTGFPCGGTPSFGFNCNFLIDEKVLDMPVVYTGGGSQTSLVKTTPKALITANNADIVDLTKD